MRTRHKTLEDYGISKEDGERLYKMCLELSDENLALLEQAAQAACEPVLAERVVESLTTGKSYDALLEEGYIPIGRDDFYAYRRKTLAGLFDLLRLSGGWDG